MQDDEINKRLANIPSGRLEYLRRWLLAHKAIRDGRWAAVKKWCELSGCPELYKSAKELHDKGIDLSGGFL